MAAATPSHGSRLAPSNSVNGDSRVLRSAAVQYLVTMLSAETPNGSDKADTASYCESRSHTRVTVNITSSATAPT